MATKNGLVTKLYLDKRLDKFKEELYQIKDEIIGEIKKMREEFNAHQFSHMRINDDISDHEKRLIKLEKTS